MSFWTDDELRILRKHTDMNSKELEQLLPGRSSMAIRVKRHDMKNGGRQNRADCLRKNAKGRIPPPKERCGGAPTIDWSRKPDYSGMSLTAILFGDPPRGRSALDQRGQRA